MSQKWTGGIYPIPIHSFFSPNASDENFEITSLFEIVQQTDNKNFIVNINPVEPGDGL